MLGRQRRSRPEPGRVRDCRRRRRRVAPRLAVAPPAGGGTPYRRRGRGSVRPAGEEELSPHAVDVVSYGERESVAPGARALTWRCR